MADGPPCGLFPQDVGSLPALNFDSDVSLDHLKHGSRDVEEEHDGFMATVDPVNVFTAVCGLRVLHTHDFRCFHKCIGLRL